MNDYPKLNTPQELAEWLTANDYQSISDAIEFAKDQGFTSAQIRESFGIYMATGTDGANTK